MEKLKIKDIVLILLGLFVFLAIRDYNKLQRRNGNKHSTEIVNGDYKGDAEVHQSENKQVFYIRGLGDVSQNDLEYTSEIIENFYGYHCIIEDNVSIPNNTYFDDGNTINAGSCVSNLDTDKKTLYLTYNPLNDGNDDLRGYTRINGETIIVRGDRSFMKGTIIHEIGHTLGLEHCSDLTCVMAIQNDEYDSGNFCENCKRIINN